MFQHIRKNSQRGVVEIVSLVLIGLTLLGSYVGTQYLSQQRLGGSSRASAPTCSSPSKSCQGNGKPWSQDSTGQYYTGFGCTGSKVSYSDLVSYCGGSSPTSTPRPAATATPRPASATYTPAPIPTASISCTGTTSCPSSCTAGCTSCTIPVGPYTRYYKCKSTSSSPTPTKSASASCTKSTEKCQQDRPWSQDSSGQYYTGNGCTGSKVSLSQLDSYCKTGSTNTPTPASGGAPTCSSPTKTCQGNTNPWSQDSTGQYYTGHGCTGNKVSYSSLVSYCGGGGGGGTGPTAPPAPTAAPGSCFSLSASVDQNNYAHVTFVNGGSASGDVQLFRNGTHVAGWNGWGGGNFTYDPPHTGDALTCGEQVTFEGWARNCNPTQQYASVTGRCDAATPTPSTGRDCSPNNSCAPDVNGNRRWCGNDAKFHDEENCNHANEGCVCTPPATPTPVPASGGGGATATPVPASGGGCTGPAYCRDSGYPNSGARYWRNGANYYSNSTCTSFGSIAAICGGMSTPTPTTGSCAGYTLRGSETAYCYSGFETCPSDSTWYRCKPTPTPTRPSGSSATATPQAGASPTAAASSGNGTCPADTSLTDNKIYCIGETSCIDSMGKTKYWCAGFFGSTSEPAPETIVVEEDPVNQYMCDYWKTQCATAVAYSYSECKSSSQYYYKTAYSCTN